MSFASRLLKRNKDEVNPQSPLYSWEQILARRAEVPLRKYKVMETGELFLAHKMYVEDGVVSFVVYTEDAENVTAILTNNKTIVLQYEDKDKEVD